MNAIPWPHLEPKVSWDGLLTFVGGLLALLAIWRQTSHADKGLQKQIDLDKKARLEEKETRRKAVAMALLFEIDSFYKSYVRDFLPYTQGDNPSEMPYIRSIAIRPFPLYEANADSICDLQSDMAADIVSFFSVAECYLCDLRDYKDARDLRLQVGSTAAGLARAATVFQRIRTAAPGIARAVHLISEKMCRLTGVPFEAPRVAIAEAGFSSVKIAEDLHASRKN